MTDAFSNGDDFLSGGDSAPAWKFEEVGVTRKGYITRVDKRVDTDIDGNVKKWPSGDDMHVFVFSLDTEDGPASVWVRGNMVTAIKEAAREAGVDTVVGCELTLKHHDLGDKKPGKFPAKLFKAKLVKTAPPARKAAPADEPF